LNVSADGTYWYHGAIRGFITRNVKCLVSLCYAVDAEDANEAVYALFSKLGLKFC
jgi:hypothetical protein